MQINLRIWIFFRIFAVDFRPQSENTLLSKVTKGCRGSRSPIGKRRNKEDNHRNASKIYLNYGY